MQRFNKNKFGFYEIVNKPTVEELKDYYANKYYQEIASTSYQKDYSEDERSYFRARNERYYSVVKKIRGNINGKFLDVGCGEGFALSYFKEKGYTFRGLDFSSEGVETQNPHCLSNLVTGDLFELLKIEVNHKNQYDVIYLQNVLEHVLDPLDLLNNLNSILAPSGVVVLTVPNDFSIIQEEAIRRKHIDQMFWIAEPDHLSYFDKESLAKVCHSAGFNVEDLLADFPIDWFLFHEGSNYVKNKSSGKNAHKARIQIECLIAQQTTVEVLGFWRALAKIGMGRDLTIFLTK